MQIKENNCVGMFAYPLPSANHVLVLLVTSH